MPISLFAANDIRNAGAITTSGGDGITGAGIGAPIDFNIGQAGNIINSGMLDSHGGSATQANGVSSGPPINMNTQGGKLLSNADLTTRGGDTQMANGFYSAGQGGPINMNINGTGNFNGIEFNAGNLQLSGDIDASGGDAPAIGDADGGSGGSINLQNNSICCSFIDAGQRISLLGYSMVDSSGASGESGGQGGTIEIYNNPDSNSTIGQIPSGNIINEANISTYGGDVAITTANSAFGGCHGVVRFQIDNQPINQQSPEGAGIINSGIIDARNGEHYEAPTTLFCDNVGLVFYAYSGITNSGAIDTSGGNDLGTDGGSTGIGSFAGSIDMRVYSGGLNNSATLTTNGGHGEFVGEFAGFINLNAATITNSARLSAAGGDADPTLSGSTGGNGNIVTMTGAAGLGSVANTANVDISGGLGVTAGQLGQHIEGGFCMAGNC